MSFTPLTHDIITNILDDPSGIFVAATVCQKSHPNSLYLTPNDVMIVAETPSSLFNQLNGSEKKTSEDPNQVSAFFEPQMVFASKEVKRKLIADLIDYAHKLCIDL